MKNLELTIGQILTLDELGTIMGFEAGNLSDHDIRTGQQTNVDNYDGNNGHNVDFELVIANEEDSAYEFTVKVTDINEL